MCQNLFPAQPILLVDDEAQALRSYDLNLRYNGINNTIRCQDSRQVMDILARQEVALVMVDLCMPQLGGEELIDLIRADHPQLPIVVVTGFNEVDTAVRCMRTGILDYLVKPVDRSRLVSSVRQALAMRPEGDREVRADVPGLGEHGPGAGFAHIVTRSPSIQAVCRYVSAVAATPEPVLILGETGVGKERFAQAIHEASGRPGRFVAVNVAGLDDNMFADTLFGHTKGAFTGAGNVRAGLIEAAGGGTLFLDEIGDLSPASQLKLLRLIQEKEYFPLGSDASKAMEAKLVVATNQTMGGLMDESRFRRDLFFRLRTHCLEIPALRERLEDLPLLIEHFLARAASKLGKKQPAAPRELLLLLSGYHFPGNVRELESMILNAMALHTGGKLSVAPFKSWIGSVTGRPAYESPAAAEADPPLKTLRQSREGTIQEALQRTGGNQSAAARLLGISRQALNRYLLRKERGGSAQ